MNKNIEGILYCARGKSYLKQAEESVRSYKRFNPNLSCTVCTSEQADKSLWNEIISLPDEVSVLNTNMKDKLDTLTRSPYLHTLYLDSDTFVLDDISDLFLLLDRFDLAICHGHDRQKRFDIQTGQAPHRNDFRIAIDIKIPYAFAPLQGGLILYKNNEKVKKWLKDLYTLYCEKNYYDDQVIIRELLWNSDINFYILPPEYNFNSIDLLKFWKRSYYKQAKPKIFHYTLNKNSNIRKLVYSIYKPEKSNWQDHKGRFPWLPEKFKDFVKKLLVKN